ncbi:GGDEF domain-containing protein [Gallaecimonas kandeliae]|uniref:diguanylate cyclase n=1 Tax=Gallaecimonas kandeliae TaxID=3029055 RepID=UPI0026473842|nr:diguanylate cyclase [Gallaecimonas kandeliae]WKE67075.1 GGDEF domain-containing protein [Gallaecimonas kandeliae]
MMAETSVSQHQIKGLNTFTLHFQGREAGLERAFREAYFHSTLSQARVAICFGIIYFCLFAALDLLVLPDKLFEAWVCRFGIFLPAGLSVLAFSYHRHFMPFYQTSLAILLILGGVCVIYLATLTKKPDSYPYYAGLLLVFMVGYGLAKLRFSVASFCCWSLVLLYEIMEFIIHEASFNMVVANQIFFMGANVVGMMICYHQEKSARQAFLLQAKLAEQNALLLCHNESLAKLSNLDGLTKVANRRHFNHFIHQTWRHCQQHKLPLSVIICDIDHFKQYNDHYGHLAGDDCLIKVARTLAQSVRKDDSLVARYGGEEFAVVLPGVYMEEALTIAERIRSNVEELAVPHHLSPPAVVTLSLGVAAVIPSKTLTQREFLQSADKALYQAKQGGRNQVQAGRLFAGKP